MDAETQSWDAAWEAALDELETSLEETQRLLDTSDPDQIATPSGWTPPVIPAPLPAEMLDRAQALLARQHQLISATVVAMSGARRNVALLNRVSDATGSGRRPERPVYVDVRA